MSWKICVNSLQSSCKSVRTENKTASSKTDSFEQILDMKCKLTSQIDLYWKNWKNGNNYWIFTIFPEKLKFLEVSERDSRSDHTMSKSYFIRFQSTTT